MLALPSRLPAQAILVVALSFPLGIAQAGLHSGIRSIFSGSQAVETCVLLADQRGYCWGNSGRAQPLLKIGQDIKAFALGTFFGCALTTDAKVSCWGSGTSGELGDGTGEDSYDAPRRVQFRGRDFADVSAITAGNSHACAIRYGQAWCWGANQFAQLGNSGLSNIYSNSPVPVMVTGSEPLANLHTISAGAQHTCALLNDNTGACWGLDSFGQLGNAQSSYGRTFTPQTIFVDSGGLKPLVMGGDFISGGNEHTCALVSDTVVDSVACWGDNRYGQLGIDSRNSEESTAFPVFDENGKITNAIGLAVGGNASCAILADTTVRCWGTDSELQLGIAAAGMAQTTGIVLLASRKGDAFSGAIQVVAGTSHFCARTLRDEIYCWGSNDWNEISKDTFTETDTPTKIDIDAPIFYDNFQGD